MFRLSSHYGHVAVTFRICVFLFESPELFFSPFFLFSHGSEAFWKHLEESRIPETFESAKGGDVGLAIKACDEEIAFAQAYIQGLRARRNTLLSVVQFPSEILGDIFRFLLPVFKLHLPDVPCEDVDAKIAAGTRSLIAASHVCRRWRNVALEHSALWTLLWIQNPSCMREMLVRSKGAPLIIIQSRQPLRCIEFLTSRLFNEIQPKRLYLSPALNADMTTLWDKVLLRPAPHLETFEIVGRFYTSVMSIPDQLFRRCAPALKHLSLAGCFSCAALWSSAILRQLVSLTLDEGSNSTDEYSRVPLGVVLGALREMRQLEALFLTFPSLYLKSSPERPPYFPHCEQEHTPAQLPRLSSLSLFGGLTDITALARHLVVPRGAAIRYAVTLREDRVHDGLTEDIAQLLHPVIPPLSRLRTSELTLMSKSDCTLHVRCWDHTLPTDASSLENFCESRFAVSFRIRSLSRYYGPDPTVPRRIQKLVEILHMVSLCLPFDQVRDLRWASHPDLQKTYASDVAIDAYEPVYNELLNVFPNTKRLFFGDTSYCKGIIQVLVSDSTLLPHLSNIHFSPSQELAREQQRPFALSPAAEAMVLEHLRELATKLRRLAETRDIQTLELRGRLIRREDVHLFEGIAKELVWEL